MTARNQTEINHRAAVARYSAFLQAKRTGAVKEIIQPEHLPKLDGVDKVIEFKAELTRFLATHELPFRGHRESGAEENQGIFLGLQVHNVRISFWFYQYFQYYVTSGNIYAIFSALCWKILS